MFKQLAILAALSVSSAYGHAFINSVAGANGVSGLGLGVTFNGEVARGGTDEQPFQLDTPVLKDTQTNPCGATLLAGSVDIPSAMAKVSAAFGGLPQIPANGTLSMGVFQVNADGGGPFTAEINVDGTGQGFAPIQVISQPPGVNGILHNGPANSSITVQIPSDVTCSGPGASCLIRLNNGGSFQPSSLANGAGPFGGCVAVSQAADASAAAGASATGAAVAEATGAVTGFAVAGPTGAAATGAAAAEPSASSKAGGGHRKSKQQKARALVEGGFTKRFEDIVERGLSSLLKARAALDAEIMEKRQLLTAQLIDELKTATGTAIDVPIDNLAGHNDAALLGGNSTADFDKSAAVLSTQQAIDLKKAVQGAIGQALGLLASDQVDAGATGQSSDITDAANAAAAKSLADGSETSINAGNAGVGAFQTQNVNSLLGALATADAALTAATAAADNAAATGAVDNAAATDSVLSAAAGSGTDAAATATATSSGRKHGHKGRKAPAAQATADVAARVKRSRIARNMLN